MVLSRGSGDGDGGGGESLSFINTAAVVVTPSPAVNHVGLELCVSTWADPSSGSDSFQAFTAFAKSQPMLVH